MVLHTLAASAGQPIVDQCLSVLTADDTLVLLGDGAYLVGDAGISEVPCPVCVLDTDLALAAIPSPESIQVIDMAALVALSGKAGNQVAWY